MNILSRFKKTLKRLLVGFLMLYGYNILVPASALISINVITVTIITILGLPGLVMLIIIKVIIY